MFESLHYGTIISTNSSLMSKNEILGIIMIITNRLIIRPIKENDWTAIKEIWDDFKNTEFVIYDNYKDTSPESLQPRVAKWEEATRKGNAHMFFATCLNGETIGFTSMNIVAPSEYEIGYGYTSKSQGHGFAKEALTAILDYMKALCATKIHAGTALKNTPSVALLKSLDFELTSTEQISFFKDDAGNDIYFEGGNFTKNLAL